MKTLFKSSLILILFAISVTVFNISCEKESIAQNVNSYTLPVATTSKLGGVIVGSGLSITTDGILSTQNSGNLGILVFAKTGDKANEFWTSKLDGTNQTKITLSSLSFTAEIVKSTIKISPDGKKLFFTLNLNPSNSQDAIYSCNIDGSALTKLIDNVDEFSDVK
jgi:hypothetical protein